MEHTDRGAMMRDLWSAASIAYLLAGKLARLWCQQVEVVERAESVELKMQNGQRFVLQVSEVPQPRFHTKGGKKRIASAGPIP